MYKYLEDELVKSANLMLYKLDWQDIQINRIKVSQMANFRGLCISDETGIYINLSVKENRDTKELVATLAHELIHARLFTLLYNKAHKHGKVFKSLAKLIAKKSEGYLTWREIVE